MSNLTFHTDKKEILNCEISVDGVKPEETSVRLCIELNEGQNLFFKGNIKNRDCKFEIPPLKNINEQSGKLYIEVIADGNYFRVYENSVDIKTAISVKIKQESLEESFVVEDVSRPKFEFSLKKNFNNFTKDEIPPPLKEEKEEQVEKSIVDMLNEKIDGNSKSDRVVSFSKFR